MRSARMMIAGLSVLLGSRASLAAVQLPELAPTLPRMPPPQRQVRRRSSSNHAMNGGKECARRVKQLQRGDVLNWYPGQVRANFRG